ncbi:hypothetical protein K1720_10225 [Thermococcus argininiproducens]|uniref:Uncharacterized protein n=1 Tax=Thermococcus argininiproducens TaxID=2866384 RepID=A0A9E7SCI4_9EURY|nr:hypothetical protein [Thermococcus argininiproducens]USG99844.1 hypothetical protein K1720_10225 [Thermococcus argininiproducens]
MEEARFKRLVAFLKALEKKTGYKFTIETFEDRMRLQKLVYLAKHFGIDLEYNFTLYIRGPYSSELADDYYKIERDYDGEIPEILDEFITEEKVDTFIEFVKDKDTEELELIATLLMVLGRHKPFLNSLPEEEREDLVVKTIQDIKPYFTKDKILEAIREIEKVKIVG